MNLRIDRNKYTLRVLHASENNMIILNDLDITNLLKASDRFNEVLLIKKDDIVRDAAIQRFEFTYGLVWKTLRKILLKRGVEANSPKTVFRLAAKDSIIDQLDVWFEFVDYRNQTVHVYNPVIAEEIYQNLSRFQALTNALISKLKTSEFK